MLGASLKDSCLRLYTSWEKSQTAITTPLILIPVGIISIVLGENVSRAFTDLGGGPVIRIMGASMVLGGGLVLTGVLSGDALKEVMGLAFTALGTAIYGGGVILGLGVQGVVAGIGYLGITLTVLGRIYLITRAARLRDRLSG